jgi:hypothetical protein
VTDKLANRVKDLLWRTLEASGMTRNEVATRAFPGRPGAAIYNAFGGKPNVKLNRLEEIANAMGYEVEVLLVKVHRKDRS